jgi:hypothetical protein
MEIYGRVIQIYGDVKEVVTSITKLVSPKYELLERGKEKEGELSEAQPPLAKAVHTRPIRQRHEIRSLTSARQIRFSNLSPTILWYQIIKDAGLDSAS